MGTIHHHILDRSNKPCITFEWPDTKINEGTSIAGGYATILHGHMESIIKCIEINNIAKAKLKLIYYNKLSENQALYILNYIKNNIMKITDIPEDAFLYG